MSPTHKNSSTTDTAPGVIWSKSENAQWEKRIRLDSLQRLILTELLLTSTHNKTSLLGQSGMLLKIITLQWESDSSLFSSRWPTYLSVVLELESASQKSKPGFQIMESRIGLTCKSGLLKTTSAQSICAWLMMLMVMIISTTLSSSSNSMLTRFNRLWWNYPCNTMQICLVSLRKLKLAHPLISMIWFHLTLWSSLSLRLRLIKSSHYSQSVCTTQLSEFKKSVLAVNTNRSSDNVLVSQTSRRFKWRLMSKLNYLSKRSKKVFQEQS